MTIEKRDPLDAYGSPIEVGDQVTVRLDGDGKIWKVVEIDCVNDRPRLFLESGLWTTWEYPENLVRGLRCNCLEDEKHTAPEHYKMQGFESIEFVDEVLNILSRSVALTPKQTYSIKDALKYTIRAGKKGPWKEDAYKCADYLCRAIYGCFISEMVDTEDKNGQD